MMSSGKENDRAGLKDKTGDANIAPKRNTSVAGGSVKPERRGLGSKSGADSKQQPRKQAVCDENIVNATTECTPLGISMRNTTTVEKRALKVQTSSENVTDEAARRTERLASVNPLSQNRVNALKKNSVAQNVQIKTKTSEQPEVVTCAKPKIPAQAKASKAPVKTKLAVSKPALPAPLDMTASITDMAKQYELLCAMEQHKLSKLEGLINKRQKVDSQFAELTRGKCPTK